MNTPNSVAARALARGAWIALWPMRVAAARAAIRQLTAPRREETAGLALGFVGVAIFAATLPMTRLALASLDPQFLAAGRAAIAGVLAIPVLALGGRPPPWREFPSLMLAAFCLTAGFPGLTGFAMRTLPAAHAGVVVGALPLATAVAAALIDRERPSPAFWACAILGALVVVGFALHHGGGGLAGADALLLGAVASAALGYTLSAQLSRRMPARDVISWIVVLALPVSASLSVLWRPDDPARVPALAWGALLYLGAMSMYLGFFAWNAAMALGGVARVAQVQLLQPFLTLALAAWLLGERIDAETAIAAFLVVALIFLGRTLRVGVARSERSPA
jgi:drug/metabolite transporter (DMT)-like permease